MQLKLIHEYAKSATFEISEVVIDILDNELRQRLAYLRQLTEVCKMRLTTGGVLRTQVCKILVHSG